MSDARYNCLIVDDEPIARDIVDGYVSQMSNLNCLGQCKNAFEAIALLEDRAEPVIVFLDINMPNLSGFSMMKILKSRHQVIFTTAYTEYAVESYEHNVVDYLVKPFTYERFAQATFKAIKRINSLLDLNSGKEKIVSQPSIYIKSGGEKFLVKLNEIIYCEAQKNYTKIYLVNDKSYSTLINISKFENHLNSEKNLFIRIHRSYIISKEHISSIGANYVNLNGEKIPIGPLYRESFFSEFNLK